MDNRPHPLSLGVLTCKMGAVLTRPSLPHPWASAPHSGRESLTLAATPLCHGGLSGRPSLKLPFTPEHPHPEPQSPCRPLRLPGSQAPFSPFQALPPILHGAGPQQDKQGREPLRRERASLLGGGCDSQAGRRWRRRAGSGTQCSWHCRSSERGAGQTQAHGTEPVPAQRELGERHRASDAWGDRDPEGKGLARSHSTLEAELGLDARPGRLPPKLNSPLSVLGRCISNE